MIINPYMKRTIKWHHRFGWRRRRNRIGKRFPLILRYVVFWYKYPSNFTNNWQSYQSILPNADCEIANIIQTSNWSPSVWFCIVPFNSTDIILAYIFENVYIIFENSNLQQSNINNYGNWKLSRNYFLFTCIYSLKSLHAFAHWEKKLVFGSTQYISLILPSVKARI